MKADARPSEWKELYRAAAKFREIEPWAWVTEEDIFGVQSPVTGEIGYCCVMGELGQVLGMAVYLGIGGLNGYLMVQQGKIEPDDSDAMFIQDCLLVSFENKSALEKEDKVLIKRLGIQANGKRAWPMFRRHKPGFFPWFLDKEEVTFLTAVLEQARDVCLRIGKDEDFLHHPKEGLYFVRTYNSEAARWADSWLAPEAVTAAPPESVKPDELSLQRIKSKAKPSKAIWELDFFYAPAPIFEGDRPFYPYSIMIVDKDTGFVHDVHMAESEKAPAEFVKRLMGCIEKNEIFPAEILVKKQEVADLLSPVTDKLKIGLRKVKELPSLEEARRSMEGHLLKEEAASPFAAGYCGDDQMEEHLLKAGSNLSVFGLYGLIFGCLAAPNPVMPSALMPAIFGKEGAKFATEAQAQEIIGSIMTLWNSLNQWEPETNEMPFPGYDYPVNKSGALHRIIDTLSLAESFCRGLKLGGMRLDDLPGELKKDVEQLERVSSLLYAQAKLIEGGKEQGKKEIQKAMKAIENGEIVIDGCLTNIHIGLKNVRLQFARQIGTDVMRKTPAASREKVGRNDPCPCGSGKKYKKCCGLLH